MNGMATPGMHGDAAWAINGHSMTGDGSSVMEPMRTLLRGQSCILTIRNNTAWWHPMHLHGHSMKVLTRNGSQVRHKQWSDTVLVAPKDVFECAFVADNPGDWMFHCHILDHQEGGMMSVIRVA